MTKIQVGNSSFDDDGLSQEEIKARVQALTIASLFSSEPVAPRPKRFGKHTGNDVRFNGLAGSMTFTFWHIGDDFRFTLKDDDRQQKYVVTDSEFAQQIANDLRGGDDTSIAIHTHADSIRLLNVTHLDDGNTALSMEGAQALFEALEIWRMVEVLDEALAGDRTEEG